MEMGTDLLPKSTRGNDRQDDCGICRTYAELPTLIPCNDRRSRFQEALGRESLNDSKSIHILQTTRNDPSKNHPSVEYSKESKLPSNLSLPNVCWMLYPLSHNSYQQSCDTTPSLQTGKLRFRAFTLIEHLFKASHLASQERHRALTALFKSLSCVVPPRPN